MRGICIALVACLAASPGLADVKTVVRTETYAIAGNSGEELLDAMDRKGPRHGLRARAMAQTRYEVDWKIDWLKSDGKCRLNSADATLSIVYRYPALAGPASPRLVRRWKTFIAGVRRHEEMHGKIARQMVAAIHRSVSWRAVGNDRYCIKSQKKIERLIDAGYDKYEARQARFDDKEHAEGGNVDRLLDMLTR
jgi:predicted secreted Zn-dependent protease